MTDFRWFFLARALTMITASMSSVAIAFAVLGISNDPRALSAVLAAVMIGNITFLLIGGVVADRLPRALVIQTCWAVNILTTGAMATLIFTGVATIPLLVALGALMGASSAFVMPAMQAILPQLVTPEVLQRATASISFVRAASTIGGPVIAGILVATAGPAWALVVEAAGLACAIPMLAMVRLPPPARSGSSLFRDLRDGWNAFRSRTWLWVIVVVFGLLNAIHIGAWGIAGPYIAKNDPALGVTGWGWVLGAEAAGTLVMTLVLMRVPLRRPLRYGMLGVAAFALPLGLLGWHPAVVPLALLAFIAGAGNDVFSTGWQLALFEHVPRDMLSRVSSYDMLGSFLAMPLGTLIFGWLLTVADARVVLMTASILFAVIALGTLLVPSVFGMRRAPDAGV
ncbi:MFS transporter [Microbacterium gorillae]|uniref:MFS transporter n=1 Tax=Microbacterium gorillae TaxID=1231063 RepID=UPI000694BF2E|nr:MFS transporter [Microbacterium gorillae]